MYDKETRLLIESAPKLKGLNVEDLSEDLSRFFTKITTLRTSGILDNETDIQVEINRLKRLAKTYEAFILSIDNHPLKDSAAFVAATAYSFISNYNEKITKQTEEHISDINISTSISSMMLFYISGYIADAQYVSNSINFKSENISRSLVFEALVSLINGDITSLNNLDYTNFNNNEDNNDLLDIAASSLWYELVKFIISLGQIISGSRDNNLETNIDDIIKRCVLKIDEESSGSGIYVFRGQYHIATLLKACIRPLESSSVSQVKPPLGTNSTIWGNFIKKSSLRRPYLWRNHVEAVDKGFLDIGTSSVISFPTGAGKSTLSELKIAATLSSGKSIVFLAPTNSLINQIVKDLKLAFPEYKVKRSISTTGEYTFIDLPSDLVQADICVMTPEKCLTQLRQNGEAFGNVGLLIFDEFHIIHNSPGNKSRNIDSMLSLLYFLETCPNADLLLISAMVDNVEDISGWLESKFSKKSIPLKIEWKPTRQIRGCIVYKKEEIESIERKITIASLGMGSFDPKNDLFIEPYAHFSLKQQWSSFNNSKSYTLAKITQNLVKLKLEKQYLSSNKVQVAASIASELASKGIKTLLFLQNSTWAKSVAKIAGTCQEMEEIVLNEQENIWRNKAALEIGDDKYLHLPINNKAAFHFSDMISFERNISESCFSRQSGLKILAATNTLAQGLNLPAEAVIIVGNDRFDKIKGKSTSLDAHELLNAAGRAGRAGFVSQGIVLVIPSRVIKFAKGKDDFVLSDYWKDLQKDVFSNADNCLTVIDPLTTILDKIFLNPELELNNILYLVQRLPFEKSEETLKSFIKKSFGVYKAESIGHEVESSINELILYKHEIDIVDEEHIWLESVSYKYGVEYKLVASLNNYLRTVDIYEHRNINEWVRIFFNWLYNEPENINQIIKRINIMEFFSKKGESKTIIEILDLIDSAIDYWISGASYLKSSQKLDLSSTNNLSKIRKVNLNIIPEISYYFGLLPLLFQGRAMSEGKNINLPIELSILSTCIREGFDNPFKLAIHTISKDKIEKSRIEVHKIFDEHQILFPPISHEDGFKNLIAYTRSILKI